MPIKWERVLVLRGSSFFVCIPPEIVKTLQWLVGDPLEIWMDEGLQAAIVKKKGNSRAENPKKAEEVVVP